MDLLLHLQHRVQPLNVPEHDAQRRGVARHGKHADHLPQHGHEARDNQLPVALPLAHDVDADEEHVEVEGEEQEAADDAEEHATVESGPPEVQPHGHDLIRDAANLAHGQTRGVADRRAHTAGLVSLRLYLLKPLEHEPQRPQYDPLRVALLLLEADGPQVLLHVVARGHPEGRVDARGALQWLRGLRRVRQVRLGEATTEAEDVVRRPRPDDLLDSLQEALLLVAVPGRCPRHATGTARQKLHHALVALPSQRILQRASLAGQLHQLLEV
mmetsp:Transcript_46495/g.133912  ORF Transcript_46495/g.133912 Transcript_46495/m.133912 type:complete len:271 (+) Transcript_46495:370-1182(+)